MTKPPTSPPRADGRHRGPEHASPYPVSRLGAPISLVDVAREIEKADALVQAGAERELLTIAEEIRGLQERARAVLERAERDASLHRARCSFERVVGRTYHLYERDDGERFFSMLSPDDWDGAPPQRFVGSYRLEPDQRFTPASEADALDGRRDALKEALGPRLLPDPE